MWLRQVWHEASIETAIQADWRPFELIHRLGGRCGLIEEVQIGHIG